MADSSLIVKVTPDVAQLRGMAVAAEMTFIRMADAMRELALRLDDLTDRAADEPAAPDA